MKRAFSDPPPVFEPYFLDIALEEARLAGERGEIPVGAAIASGKQLLSRKGNMSRQTRDPTAHAEICAIREACSRRDSRYLKGCVLYVSLEPCAMCAGAIAAARLDTLYFAAFDLKGGAVENGVRFFSNATCLHKLDYAGGFKAVEAALLLQRFFYKRR